MKQLVLVGAWALLASACATASSVSTQDEVSMGSQAAQQVKSELPMLQDAQVNAYVRQLGTRIAKLTSRGSELDWQFAVVNSDVVNAFALPGGFIYVNRGVLQRAATMNELAGVLAHEIEHVVLRHSVEQMAQAQNANVGVGLLCALTGVCDNQAAQAGIGIGIAGSAIFAKFSRGDEIEADQGGFNNVVPAGIHPRGMLTFFQKLLAEEQASGGSGATAAWFSDHPGTQDRVADIQRMLNLMSASQLRGLSADEAGFRSMKSRLARLPAAPRPKN